MTIPTKSQVIFGIQTCCVCGLIDCSQSIDHQYFPLQELIETIQQNKKEATQIDQLKTDVRNKFLKLRRQLFAMLKSKQESIVKWLNSFYFSHLKDFAIQNVSIFCDVLENDFSKLPNRKISKTIKSLQRQNNKKKDEKLEVQSIRNDIRQLLSRMQIEKITKSIQLQLSVQKILKRQSSIKLSKSNKSTKSQATTASEKKIELSPVLQTYEWKYIRFTRNTKSADLNNRSITDEDMIKQLPIISTFTNIRQLEIRNNKITALTCNIVANSMRFLTVLDLRGNKVGDAGVRKVVTAISGLKSLFVSETGITDVTGDLVAGNLHDLETFWSEHTKLTGISSRKICKKPKLRLLSLIGNPIEQHDKEELKALFISKGYLNI